MTMMTLKFVASILLIYLGGKLLKIIRTFDQKKNYRHDDISVRILKRYGLKITKPLRLLFDDCAKQERFHTSG